MLCSSQEVRSWTDYIRGMYYRLFQNMAVRDLRHNTYHYMVMGCLFSVNLRENQRYLGSRTRVPLYPLNLPSHADTLFVFLRHLLI